MSDAARRPRDSDEVIIAVAPHKASWTAVVVDGGLAAVGDSGDAGKDGDAHARAHAWNHAPSSMTV